MPGVRSSAFDGCRRSSGGAGPRTDSCDQGAGRVSTGLRCVPRGCSRLLRMRKRRSRKPFAVMMRDMKPSSGTAFRIGMSALCWRRGGADRFAPLEIHACSQCGGAGPGLYRRHVALHADAPSVVYSGPDPLECLVMTSGNISEEPIVLETTRHVEKLSWP